MNKNVRIAKELIKIAKSLVANDMDASNYINVMIQQTYNTLKTKYRTSKLETQGYSKYRNWLSFTTWLTLNGDKALLELLYHQNKLHIHLCNQYQPENNSGQNPYTSISIDQNKIVLDESYRQQIKKEIISWINNNFKKAVELFDEGDFDDDLEYQDQSVFDLMQRQLDRPVYDNPYYQ